MTKLTEKEARLTTCILERIVNNAMNGNNSEELTTDESLIFTFDKDTLDLATSAIMKITKDLQKMLKKQKETTCDIVQFEGMNFQDWCALDKNDERKIHYETSFGKFTSDDWISGAKMEKLTKSIIQKIELKNNEWFVTLEELRQKNKRKP